jgi:hypothetical protein
MSTLEFIPGDKRTSSFECAYRRYVADGFVSARYEVAVARRKSGLITLPRFSSGELLLLLRNFMEMPVSIPSWEGTEVRGSSPLGLAGKPLAAHLLQVTTKGPLFSFPTNPSWVLPGRPLLLVETSPLETELEFPSTAKVVDLPEETGLRLINFRISHHGKTVVVWIIERSIRGSNKLALRHLRLHLCRLHMEYECVRIILRGLTSREEEARDDQNLKKFLEKGIELLSRERNYGFDQDPILASAYGAEDIVNAEERNTVRALLRERHKSQLDRILEVASATAPSPVFHIEGVQTAQVSVQLEKGATMTDKSVNIGDNFQGQGVFGSDNVVQKNNFVRDNSQVIDNSAASVELKDLLDQLTKATAEAAERMPREKADQCLRDFRNFRDEAIADEPRKSVLETLGGALSATARLAGDFGVPIVELAAKVIAFF